MRNNINKRNNRSAFHATVSRRYQASKPNLEQLIKTPGAVTDALNWHAGLVGKRNKRAILSVR